MPLSLEQIILKHRDSVSDNRFILDPNPLRYMDAGNDASNMNGVLLEMLHGAVTAEVGADAARAFANMVNCATDHVCGFVILSGLQRLEQAGWVYDGFAMTRKDALDYQVQRAFEEGNVLLANHLQAYTLKVGNQVIAGHICRGFLEAHSAELDKPHRFRPAGAAPKVA